MGHRPIRLTMPTRKVMDFLLAHTGEEPLWGLAIIEGLDSASGTVYPILHRLESVGWIFSEWEGEKPEGGHRSRRRPYRVTAFGERQYRAALARKGIS